MRNREALQARADVINYVEATETTRSLAAADVKTVFVRIRCLSKSEIAVED